jgi:chemotaxis protein MotB
MARPSRDTPIIIRKKKVAGHGHHGGAWKVAFADFMTAMFALFLVLWLVNQSADVKAAIANYFRDPVGFEQGGNMQLAIGGADSPQAERQIVDAVTAQRRAQLTAAGERIRRALARSPALAAVSRNVTIELTPEGLRISMTEDDDANFFESGSPRLEPHAVEVLGVVARELSALGNPLLVEGHTDARPLHRGDGYSNWELSTDRAHQARRLLAEAGIAEERIQQVRGFADRDLLVADDPFSPRNRRITITALDTPPTREGVVSLSLALDDAGEPLAPGDGGVAPAMVPADAAPAADSAPAAAPAATPAAAAPADSGAARASTPPAHGATPHDGHGAHGPTGAAQGAHP